jgi:hypothetical protein
VLATALLVRKNYDELELLDDDDDDEEEEW